MMPYRTFTVLAVAFFAALAAPATAHADPYVSEASVSADRYTVTAGESVTVTWSESYFDPGEDVTVSVAGTVVGTAAESSIMSASGPAERGSATATAADLRGGTSAQVTFTTDAIGRYAITGSAASATGGVTITVVASTASALPAQAIDAAPALALTGGSLPVVLGITGGGMLFLGAVLVSARVIARRRTATSAHFTGE